MKEQMKLETLLKQRSNVAILNGWYVGGKSLTPGTGWKKRTTQTDPVLNQIALVCENFKSGKTRACKLTLDDGNQAVLVNYNGDANGRSGHNVKCLVLAAQDGLHIQASKELENYIPTTKAYRHPESAIYEYIAMQAAGAYFLAAEDAYIPYKAPGLSDFKNEAERIMAKDYDVDDLCLLSDIFLYGVARPLKLNVEFGIDENFQQTLDQYMRLAYAETPDISREIEGVKSARKATSSEKTATNSLLTCTLSEFKQRVLNRDLVLDYKWEEPINKLIPSIDRIWEKYVLTETVRRMIVRVYMSLNEKLNLLKEGKSIDEIMDSKCTVENLLLIGPPDSGKSYAVVAMCAALGLPHGIHTCQANMEESQVEGDPKVINGKIQTIPSKVGELFPVGGCITLEEMNLVDPGVLQGVVGQALEYPYIFKYFGYYEMKRHPLTVFVGTMNPETEGTRPLNEALASRFSHTVVIKAPERDEMVERLMSDSFDRLSCEKVYGIYLKITNYLERYDKSLLPRISGRACRECLTSMKYGYGFADAVEESFLGQIYAASPDMYDDVKQAIGMVLS